MKKIVLMLFMCFVLTGCGNTLKCSSNVETGTMNIKQTYKISYDKDNITRIVNTTKYKIVDENLKQNFGSLINFTKADYEAKNIEYNYTNKGDNYTIEAFYEIDFMTEEVFNELVGTKSLKEYRNKLEQEGMECK